MTTRARKYLAGAAIAASLIGLSVTPAQAAPSASGFWSNKCEFGHACLEFRDIPSWWNIVGCGHHDIFMIPVYGKAHGNTFRVTYQNDRWDEVARWTERPLDSRNQLVSAYVFCP